MWPYEAMSHENPAPAKPPSPENHSQITLSRDELTALLEQAAARGAALALHRDPNERFLNAAASEYVYGRPGKIEAWRQLRIAYPELDAASTGTGAARHWTREALDAFLDRHPQFRRRAERAA